VSALGKKMTVLTPSVHASTASSHIVLVRTQVRGQQKKR